MMETKKFYATNMPAAMRDIRRVLGPDAVILSTRSLPPNTGIHLLDGRATVEVTAAREASDPVGSHSRGAGNRPLRAEPAFAAVNSGTSANRISSKVVSNLGDLKTGAGNSEALSGLLGEIKALQDLLGKAETKDKSLRTMPQTAMSERRNGGFSHSSASDAAGYTSIDQPSIQSERASDLYRRTESQLAEAPTGSLLHSGQSQFSPDAVLPVRQFQKQLMEQGMDELLIQRIIGRMRCTSNDSSRKNMEETFPSDAHGTFRQFVQAVHGFIPVIPKSSETKPHKIAMVGPTGVGKTTTLAKIASRSSLYGNKKVALVTLDTYRIAAADQLKTYARLLGVPLEIVNDPTDLQASFDKFADMDEILIDTPGYSPKDAAGISRLAAVFRAHDDIEAHLLITCSTRGQEMQRILQYFQPIRFDRLIFSKLDEAAVWGDLMNTWIMGGYPVSYFTTGQRVPEDLEVALVDSMCQRLLSPVDL